MITTNSSTSNHNKPFDVLFVNDGFEKIFQTPRQKIIDDPHYLRHFIHPDDIKAVTHWWENVCNAGLKKEVSMKYKVILPDGSTRMISDYIKPIGIIGKQPVRFGILTDITRSKKPHESCHCRIKIPGTL